MNVALLTTVMFEINERALANFDTVEIEVTIVVKFTLRR